MEFNIKLEQKIVAVCSIAGAACGILSNYLAPFGFAFALLLPIAAYVAILMAMIKFIKERRLRTLISNSMITFFLVWLMVWVFLYNL